MSLQPRNGERVIITAKYIVDSLMEIFADREVVRMLVEPWTQPTPEKARIRFYERRLSIMLDVNFPFEARQITASAIQDFENAYMKCSVFEREAIRKDLEKMGYGKK